VTPEFAPWRIEHVDIGAALPEIGRTGDEAAVLVVLWLRGVPLGQLHLGAGELPLAPSALEALVPQTIAPAVADRLFGRPFQGRPPAHHSLPPQDLGVPDLAELLEPGELMARLEETLAEPPPASWTLSVVICTRDRPEQLELCLRSLDANLPYIDEVIVVDNAPRSGATRMLVEGREKVRYVCEPTAGLSVARNTGVAHASGDIIAFTDDDVVVHADWVRRLRAAFTGERTMCVTGLVLPSELRTEAQVAFERSIGGFGAGFLRITYDGTFFDRMKRFGVPVWAIGAGANMAVRRSAIDRVGGFDTRLGAGASGCSEDSEFWYRVLAAGYECKYEPAAVVFHCHRREWLELRRQMRAYTRGHVTALLVKFARHGHGGNMRRLLVAIPLYYSRLLFQGLRKRFAGRYRLVGEEVAGCILGVAALPAALSEWVRRRFSSGTDGGNSST